MLGHINFNLLNELYGKDYTYLDNLFENYFILCITMTTHIADHSATITDHMFIKPPKNDYKTNVHLGIYTQIFLTTCPISLFLTSRPQKLMKDPSLDYSLKIK